MAAPCYMLYNRYTSNISSLVPYPYILPKIEKTDDYAPILIIGDRLAFKLSSFQKYMSSRISENLSKNVKIITLATKGEGLHRTLQKVRALKKTPLITIYLGGSEETNEQRFYSDSIPKVLKNFKYFSDDRLQTLMMIYPTTSRLIYENIRYKKLAAIIQKDTNEYSDQMIQKRNVIHFKMYEQELNELFGYLKDKGSYVFALTQPLNYNSPPKKSCEGSLDKITEGRLEEVVSLIRKQDYKKAYSITKDLVLIANSNAKILYIHGQVASNLGLTNESENYLERSIAFDCSQWRGSPIYNNILSKSAYKNEVVLFDFDKYLKKEKDKSDNIVFSDDVLPQNLYFEKVVNILSARIKKMLKL